MAAFNSQMTKCLKNLMSEELNRDNSPATESEEVKALIEAEGINMADGEAKPEEKPEVKEPEKEPEETSKSDETEDKTEETDEPAPAEDKKPKREQKFVPVSKFNDIRKENAEMKKREAELNAKIQELSNRPTQTEVDTISEKAKAYAEKYGYDTDQTKELLGMVKDMVEEKTKTPDEVKSLSERLNAYDAERKLAAEEKAFNKEFENLVQDYPELADVKDDFKRQAFTEGYETTPLNVLAAWYVKDLQPKITAERASKGKAVVIDYDNVSEEWLATASEAQLDKYFAHQRSKGKN